MGDRWSATTLDQLDSPGPDEVETADTDGPGESGPVDGSVHAEGSSEDGEWQEAAAEGPGTPTDGGRPDGPPARDRAGGAMAGAGPDHVAYPHEPGYLYDCPACEARCHCDGDPASSQCVFEGEHHGPDLATESKTSRHGAGRINGNGTGAAVMVSTTTGEAPNIEAARDALQALRAEAEQTVARVDQLSASLQSADLDAQTLGEVAEVLEAADVMKAAADKALSGMQSRHAVMEEAVNSTAHAAKTDWYRH